jgi:prepilin peptidase CpaA
MASPVTIHLTVLALFCGLAAWGAVSDFRRFTIPNQVSLALLGLNPVFVVSAPEPIAWMFSLLMAVIFFGVGFLMFCLRAMGAGDVKLMTAVVLWVGPNHFMTFLVVLVACGILLGVLMAARAANARLAEEEAKPGADGAAAARSAGLARALKVAAAMRYVPIFKMQVPYGVAIAAGGIAVAINVFLTTLR